MWQLPWAVVFAPRSTWCLFLGENKKEKLEPDLIRVEFRAKANCMLICGIFLEDCDSRVCIVGVSMEFQSATR